MGDTPVTVTVPVETDPPPPPDDPPPPFHEEPPAVEEYIPCYDCRTGLTCLKCQEPYYRNMRNVRALIDQNYNSQDSIISTSMDLLALYMQGQKTLYTEAKVLCEQQLNMLMLPAIFISSLCTLLSVSLKDIAAGSYIVSSLTGINAFVLAVVSYLKLDAKAEAHKTTAYQFDKLQTLCEFNSGKVLFFKEDSETPVETKKKIIDIVEEIETKVKEIKDTNKFILPEHVRLSLAILYDQNIFSDVKRIELEELQAMTRLRAKLNLVIYWKNQPKSAETQTKIEEATVAKDLVIAELIQLRGSFASTASELKKAVHTQIDQGRRYGCRACDWLKT